MKNKSTNPKGILSLVVVVALAFAVFYFSKQSPNVSPEEQAAKTTAGQVLPPATPTQNKAFEAPASIATPQDTSHTAQQEIPADLKAQLESIPPELPEDLKQQMMNPVTELPEDLKAQLNSPPPPIPDDIKRAMETPPRVVSEAEVNDPNWQPGQ